ncbi:MAG: RNA polymerase sigma factor RpoD/SigA [Armatimonadetes bacterium]|nr:RNA polymerase sigma factor RpoD/SigA [Armatimonadota bacterium]MBS1710788.1 RNA polymerase sigma factor RpoD/SigA [Armatimonadota bacterium]MBX3108460.1 RNA polymerase sigma factor RpoD/SigA [Fimbriimonadaceae bacterium]
MTRESTASDPGIGSYLSRLTQAPLLSAEEERVLTVAAQNGSAAARERLVESNIRLVINIAKGYHSRQIPLEDLIQEGAIGLITAIERFDPGKGFRFSTYATHWIKQSIGRAVDSKSKTIRLPAHISQTLRRIEKTRTDIMAKTGCDPTHEQIAREMGISLRKLASLMQASQELISLEIRVGDGESSTLGSLLPDTANRDPEEAIIDSEVIEELNEFLNLLTDRERRIVQYRLRNDDGTSRFRDELSVELRITRERVRQIEIQAIKKLRQIASRRRTKEYLG